MKIVADTSGAERHAGRFLSAAGTLLRQATDIALPPRCLACEAPTADAHGLCAACWAEFRLIDKPYCARLGIPFSYDPGGGALSMEAIADPPPFDRSRAVAVFDDVSRQLVHGLKYRDRLELARPMGRWMRRAGGELVNEADAIVPIPLHRRRLWWRRANQSALLAQEIARASGKPFAPELLTRHRPTRQQVGFTRAERERNVSGAFRAEKGAAERLKGKRVLLVDDVYTTGATVKAATRALLRAGAEAVDVLVFARVIEEV